MHCHARPAKASLVLPIGAGSCSAVVAVCDDPNRHKNHRCHERLFADWREVAAGLVDRHRRTRHAAYHLMARTVEYTEPHNCIPESKAGRV